MFGRGLYVAVDEVTEHSDESHVASVILQREYDSSTPCNMDLDDFESSQQRPVN